MRKAGGLFIFLGIIELIGAIIMLIVALKARDGLYFIICGIYFVMAIIQISVGSALQNDADRVDKMNEMIDYLSQRRKRLEDQVEELKLEIRDLKKKNNNE